MSQSAESSGCRMWREFGVELRPWQADRLQVRDGVRFQVRDEWQDKGEELSRKTVVDLRRRKYRESECC